jgi:hypothetical protein
MLTYRLLSWNSILAKFTGAKMTERQLINVQIIGPLRVLFIKHTHARPEQEFRVDSITQLIVNLPE